MHTLTIPYSDHLLVTSGQPPEVLEAELRLLLAVKLFEPHKLSLGKAAEFGCLGKVRCMFVPGRLGFPW